MIVRYPLLFSSSPPELVFTAAASAPRRARRLPLVPCMLQDFRIKRQFGFLQANAGAKQLYFGVLIV